MKDQKYKYRVFTFEANGSGTKRKLETIEKMEQSGWEVHEERIEKASFDGPKACCGALICLPLVLLGFKNEKVIVSFRKEVE